MASRHHERWVGVCGCGSSGKEHEEATCSTTRLALDSCGECHEVSETASSSEKV